MKKGIIRQIPLQAELCLNKQKVDIEDFKGWNKCNAPVYGNCLSPLYKKENTHHDIYIGDDTYDWESGVLYKNGTAVLSGVGSKKIKKTELTQDCDAMEIHSNNIETLKILSSNQVRYGSNFGGTEYTVANCQRIVCTKVFHTSWSSGGTTYNSSGFAILYLSTSGYYAYYIHQNYSGGQSYDLYGPGDTSWNNFEVVSPLIQYAAKEGNILFSFFGKSGADVSSTMVRNVVLGVGVVHNNPTFNDATLYPTRYQTQTTSPMSVIANIYTYLYYQPDTYPGGNNPGIHQQVHLEIDPHPYYPIKINLGIFDYKNYPVETLTFPATDKYVIYDRHVTVYGSILNYAYYKTTLDVWEGSTRIISQSVNGQVSISNPLPPKLSQDYSNTASYKFYSTYARNGDGSNSMSYVQLWLPTLVNENDVNTDSIYEFTETASDTPNTKFGYINVQGPKLGVITYMNFALSQDGQNQIPTCLQNPEYFQWRDVTSYSYSYGGGAIIFNGRYGSWDCKTWRARFCYNADYYPPNKDNAFDYAAGYLTLSGKYKTPYTEQSLKDVDCCMDDGKLYTVLPIVNNENTPMPTKLFALTGTITGYNSTYNRISYTSTSTFNITYDQDDATNVFPKYFKGMSISISNYYLRIVYMFKAKQADTEYINIMIDSPSMAEGEKAAHLYAGVQRGTYANLQGAVKNTTNTEGFRLLFNNNMISNISCYENKRYLGTILADWFTIDETFCPAFSDTVLYYKDIYNHLHKIELVTTGQDWEYKFVENRYIVLNTTNYFNCYDTKTGLKRHWASDYNNRTIYGYAFSTYTNNSTFRSLLTSVLFSGLMITGQNANYEATNDTITSIEIAPINYYRVLKDWFTFYSCETPYGATEGIDFYRADNGSTSALYVFSYQNNIKYINSDLVNPYVVYPIPQNGDIRYNPNLFTRFITSYNNKDMVISDGVAYRLAYYNNVIPIMSYYLLDGVEELKAAFVLQSGYYGVSDTRLYQMNYSNGVSVEVVCDITNLEYLGALPTQALFWSAQNRAIYSFRGNCIMSLTQYANDLSEIKGKWYNPATQELFLDTNIGLLVFSDLGTYCLPKFVVEIPPEQEGGEPTYEEKDIEDIFFYPDKFIINLKDYDDNSFFWSYNLLTGYSSNRIHFITKYYGNARTPITVNNIYIRLFNQEVQNAQGTIKFKGHTVTDIGVQTDEREVIIGGTDGEEWDAETNTILVKYTPQYNRGIGFALEVDTTFPIVDIKYDYVEDAVIESQIAHVNI